MNSKILIEIPISIPKKYCDRDTDTDQERKYSIMKIFNADQNR